MAVYPIWTLAPAGDRLDPMFKKILAPALGIAVLATAAVAQQYGQPQQPQTYQPPGGQQVSQACVRLEAQLVTLNNQNQADPQNRQIEAAYNEQRGQLERMTARARNMGCGRNFLFGPRPPAECRPLQNQIDQTKDQVDRLEDQLRRGRGDPGLIEARRRDLITALAQNRCGPQYEAAMPREQRGGLFGFLFGGGGRQGGFRDNYPGGPMEGTQTSTYRTVCVRTCDGFFFPVSYATVPARFGQDANQCQRTCPGTEAMLFSYPTGGSIDQGTATNGTPYTSLPNAFKYQTEYVKDCSCKPAGQSWEQALAGADDTTLQRGDIVVDEERSRAMSQPAGGEVSVSPDEAARAAQDNALVGEGVVEGAANTEVPPGYVPDPAAQTAEPYYAPPAQGANPYYAPPQQQQVAPPPQQQQPRQPERGYVHPNFR